MTDAEIIELYFERSEAAIEETAKRYGAYCSAIAMNILHNREDGEECVNDTFLKAWNAIPPQRPVKLSSFLGRITRNLSLNKYESRNTQKRIGNETALLLSELEEMLPIAQNVEEQAETNELAQEIDKFLLTIERQDAAFMVRRYWYGDSVTQIAKRFDAGESRVKTNLFRTRKKLKNYLESRGIIV